MAQQYDPNFNQVPLPAINPQMAAPVGVDLGIQRVEAEFNRQEAGLRENIAQQRQNMRILEQSAQTQMRRTEQDWKSYEKLKDFSETVGRLIVDRQQDVNAKEQMEAVNKVMASGVTLEQYQAWKRGEEESEEEYQDSVKIATHYKENGGLPDVAALIEGRSGHAAFGAALGMVMNGKKNYQQFLNQNKETVLGYRDGNPENTSADNIISLATSTNSAEYLQVQQMLSQQYYAPYAGLNPVMLNEYLLQPMREIENREFINWEAEFEKTEELKRLSQEGAALADANENPVEGARILESQIRAENTRLGGNAWALAREKKMEALWDLGRKGYYTEGEARALMDQEIMMRGGKRKFGNTAEGREFLRIVRSYHQSVHQQNEADKLRERQALQRWVTTYTQKKGPMDEETVQQVRDRAAELGFTKQQINVLMPEYSEQEATVAAELIQEKMMAGEYIPPGLIKALTFKHKPLFDEATQYNANRGDNIGMTQVQRESLDKVINGWAAAGAGYTPGGEPKAGAAQAARRAFEWAQRWWQDNRFSYETSGKALEVLESKLQMMFEGINPETNEPYNVEINGKKRLGFEASPFNTEVVAQEIGTQAEQDKTEAYRINKTMSEQAIQKNIAGIEGPGNPYSMGAIPGTSLELEKVKKFVEENGVLPPRSLMPIFNNLAVQAGGTWSFEHILKSQLKEVYNMDFETEYEAPKIDTGATDASEDFNEFLQQRPQIRLLNVHPTPQTRQRAVLNYENMRMQDASQQGALSDPNNPDSPRIGDWIGGDIGRDGDLIAQANTGQGGQYTLNVQAIPRGLGGAVQAAADKYGIPAYILAGLLEQESSWRSNPPNAGAGAVGIAQIIPRWHPEANPGVNDADDIMYAASYLRRMMDSYDWDLKTAIYAYNAGPNTVLQHGVGASQENKDYWPLIQQKSEKYRRRSYVGVRDKYQARVIDSPYNSPDLLSPNLRGIIYKLA